MPLFLSVALGLSAIETGVRLLPLSITLLLAAAGIPKVFPDASPRRVVRLGFAGAVRRRSWSWWRALDAGAGPEIVTWPMLLAGLGIGALASQLGSVTVSSVPDEQSSEVGGLQNTITNLGISVGTALAGAMRDRRAELLVPERRPGKPGGARAGRVEGHESSWPEGSRSSPTKN